MSVSKEELARSVMIMAEVSEEITSQDNLCTGDPIFMVQTGRRIYGESITDYDGYTWLIADGGDVIDYEEGTKEFETAEEYLCDFFKNKENWYKNYYKTIWHNLQPFFTRKGAQRYIDENKHNLSEPRIFVESAYRNREWIAVRTFLRDCWNKGDVS